MLESRSETRAGQKLLSAIAEVDRGFGLEPDMPSMFTFGRGHQPSIHRVHDIFSGQACARLASTLKPVRISDEGAVEDHAHAFTDKPCQILRPDPG